MRASRQVGGVEGYVHQVDDTVARAESQPVELDLLP